MYWINSEVICFGVGQPNEMIIITFLPGVGGIFDHLLLHVSQKAGIAMMTVCQDDLHVFQRFNKPSNYELIVNDAQYIPYTLRTLCFTDRMVDAFIHIRLQCKERIGI